MLQFTARADSKELVSLVFNMICY